MNSPVSVIVPPAFFTASRAASMSCLLRQPKTEVQHAAGLAGFLGILLEHQHVARSRRLHLQEPGIAIDDRRRPGCAE